jgi:hypothetical protein
MLNINQDKAQEIIRKYVLRASRANLILSLIFALVIGFPLIALVFNEYSRGGDFFVVANLILVFVTLLINGLFVMIMFGAIKTIVSPSQSRIYKLLFHNSGELLWVYHLEQNISSRVVFVEVKKSQNHFLVFVTKKKVKMQLLINNYIDFIGLFEYIQKEYKDIWIGYTPEYQAKFKSYKH